MELPPFSTFWGFTFGHRSLSSQVANSHLRPAMNLQFGPGHENHRRVPWPTELENIQVELPSSLLPHLSCNTALSALESNHVKELRDKLRAAEALVNEKICRLQDELVQAQAELGRLEKQRFACDVALAPVRTLPHDILYQVFRHLPLYSSPNIHIPTRLSRVSTFWRDVAHGMPHLWQLIRLSDRQSISVSESLLKHFGCLSGSLPLTIEIDNAVISTQNNSDFKVLRWVLTRWQDRNRLHTLEISTKRQCPLIQELSSLPDIPLSLQTFRHQISADKRLWLSTTDASDIIPLLNRFPQLTAMWICVPKNITRLFSKTTRTVRSWVRLTRLFLDWSSTLDIQVQFWNLLQICPNLEVLVYLGIDVTWQRTVNRGPSKVFVHNSLRELGLHLGVTGVHMHTILSCCRFPQVTSLHLEVSGMASPAIKDPVAATCAFPSLQSLVISGDVQIFKLGASLDSILTPFSTITNLTILCLDTPASIETSHALLSPCRLYTLSNIHLRFSCHQDTETSWSDRRFDDYGPCVQRIMELRSRPALRSLLIECVQWPDDVIQVAIGGNFESAIASRCVALQRSMEGLCAELRRKLAEETEDASDVHVDIRVVKTTGPFPLTPIVDHFLAYFS